MFTAKFSTKRVLGVALATGLALTGTVAVAANSDAAVTVAALKLNVVTGSTVAGTIVSVTGKGFQSAAGASKVGAIYFSTATCATSAKLVNPASPISVVSDTKIVVTTPTLALVAAKPTAYNLCVDDTADANVIGTAKFTSYSAPYINTTGLSTTSGASYGGDTLTVTGENFTTKTTATVNGLALTGVKVVIGTGTTASGNSGDDTITGIVPAGSGSAKAVVVTTEGGPVSAAQAFAYLDAVKVSPAFGDGTVGNVVTLTGVSFKTRSFASTPTALKSNVALVKAGVSLAVGAAAPALLCTNIQVVSDTELNCQLPSVVAASAGAYTIVIDTLDNAGTPLVAAASAVSRGATYTVSAF
jgi:IPT/TIG domain